MDALIRNGLIADVALVVLAVEALAICWFGRQGALRDTAGFLVAGAGLMVALKAALAGWPAGVVLAGLSLSGVAHAFDLARRLRR